MKKLLYLVIGVVLLMACSERQEYVGMLERAKALMHDELMSIATSVVWALTSLGSSTLPRVATREATLARASAIVCDVDAKTQHPLQVKYRKKRISYREKYLENLEIQEGACTFAPQTLNMIEIRNICDSM